MFPAQLQRGRKELHAGRTFQGVRYSLFHYNTGGAPSGYADFAEVDVYEPRPRGLTQPIPVGKPITLASLADDRGSLAVKDGVVYATRDGTPFMVIDRGRGRIALQAPGGGLLSVGGNGARGPGPGFGRSPGSAP